MSACTRAGIAGTASRTATASARGAPCRSAASWSSSSRRTRACRATRDARCVSRATSASDERPPQLRFSIWSGDSADAAVSLTEEEAARLACFVAPPSAGSAAALRAAARHASALSNCAGYDRRVRYPGRSLRPRRHGHRLRRDHPRVDAPCRRRPSSAATGADQQLMQAVGGPGARGADGRVSIRRVSTSSSASTARTTSRCTTRSSAASAWRTCCTSCATRGHRLGIVTAKRRITVDLAFARLPIEHLFETVVGGDETEQHKPHPAPLLLALAAPRRASRGCGLRRRLAVRHAVRRKAAGLYAIGVTLGPDPRRER